MKRPLFLAGLFLVPALLATQAHGMSLYSRIALDVFQYDGEWYDGPVNEFVEQVLARHKVYYSFGGGCALRHWTPLYGTPGSPPPFTHDSSDTITCTTTVERSREIARQEQRVRKTGRELQSIATSFELPLRDLPENTMQLMKDLRGILTIWHAGTGSVKSTTSGALLRTVVAPEAAVRPALENLLKYHAWLKGDGEDEGGGQANPRYGDGVRLIRGDRAPRFPPPVFDEQSALGTERYSLSARADKCVSCGPTPCQPFETSMMILWNAIEGMAGNADLFPDPLGANEVVQIVFPKKLLKDLGFNPHYILWARLDGNAAEGRPWSDVGLVSDLPLLPVYPDITYKPCPLSCTGCDAFPIMGGTYPPEPVDEDEEPMDGRLLCTNPSAARGFLCRALDSQKQQARCGGSSSSAVAADNEITLTTCTQTGAQRFTAAGPDVCRESRYLLRDFDPETDCTIDVQCVGGSSASSASSDCFIPGDSKGYVNPKNDDGVVSICLKEDVPDINLNYTLYHELIHAYTFCRLPPNISPYGPVPGSSSSSSAASLSPEERKKKWQQDAATCCEFEGTAYRAMCDLMERDGVFKGATAVDGIPINAETCAEAMTNASCGQGDGGFAGCYVSRQYSIRFYQELSRISKASMTEDTPTTCAGLRTSNNGEEGWKDLRIAGVMQDLERERNLCEPGRGSEYQNRIGNNLCFIGQCVEESAEIHRFVGGRTPSTVQEETSPWDSPLTSVPLGTVLKNPLGSTVSFPPYRPQLLVATMEEALCQALGMPPRTPPVLCTLEAARHLDIQRQELSQIAGDTQRQIDEATITIDDLITLSPSLGARVGTNLYADYLRQISRPFAALLADAAKLLQEMLKLRFPTEMCPMEKGLPSVLRQAQDDTAPSSATP